MEAATPASPQTRRRRGLVPPGMRKRRGRVPGRGRRRPCPRRESRGGGGVPPWTRMAEAIVPPRTNETETAVPLWTRRRRLPRTKRRGGQEKGATGQEQAGERDCQCPGGRGRRDSVPAAAGRSHHLTREQETVIPADGPALLLGQGDNSDAMMVRLPSCRGRARGGRVRHGRIGVEAASRHGRGSVETVVRRGREKRRPRSRRGRGGVEAEAASRRG